MLYRQLGQPARALATLHHLLDTYPPGEEPQLSLLLEGQTLADLGRPTQAAESLHAAVRRGPPNARGLLPVGPGPSGRRAITPRPRAPQSKPWPSTPPTSPAGCCWCNWRPIRLRPSHSGGRRIGVTSATVAAEASMTGKLQYQTAICHGAFCDVCFCGSLPTQATLPPSPYPYPPARGEHAHVCQRTATGFVCRPAKPSTAGGEPLFERRQFANSYDELSPEAAELARAIDGYKVQHRRRFITFEEMLARDQIAGLLGKRSSCQESRHRVATSQIITDRRPILFATVYHRAVVRPSRRRTRKSPAPAWPTWRSRRSTPSRQNTGP